jgi:hypothetical protein
MSTKRTKSPQEVFFVTGLPRSRTTWLSNYLTYGNIWCHHDLLLKTPHMDWFDDALRRPGAQVTGDSDSALPLAYEEINKWYPQAKWIVVLRNRMDAQKSYLKYFREHPYQRQRPLNWEQMEAAFELMDRRLTSIIEHPEISKRTLVVMFDQLERAENAFPLLQFLGPNAYRGVPERIWTQRWAMLNKMTVNPASRKIAINEDWSSKWVQAALDAA